MTKDEFLELYNKTEIFEDKLKSYCRFMDSNKKNPEIKEEIKTEIGDDFIDKCYEVFGSSGCKKYSWNEKNLRITLMMLRKL